VGAPAESANELEVYFHGGIVAAGVSQDLRQHQRAALETAYSGVETHDPQRATAIKKAERRGVVVEHDGIARLEQDPHDLCARDLASEDSLRKRRLVLQQAPMQASDLRENCCTVSLAIDEPLMMLAQARSEVADGPAERRRHKNRHEKRLHASRRWA